MREILFRGKREQDGAWVYGIPVCTTTNCHVKGIEIIDTDGISYDELDHFNPVFSSDIVIPESVGQYTGCTDKHGNKIFEGDIVKARIEAGNHQNFEWPIMRVSFCNGSFCMLDWKESVFANLSAFAPYVSFEVIGNIHDNPELVKEEA